jgi:hypothetical protein
VTDVIAYDQADKSGIFTKTIVSAHEKGQNDNPSGRRDREVIITPEIALARLKSSEILIEAKDWDGAGYLSGHVLECALKAAVCKTLNLLVYPEYTKNEKTDGYFMTHKFDQLLIASGLESIFSSRGPIEAFQYWSDFTKEYPSDWPAMRYDRSR